MAERFSNRVVWKYDPERTGTLLERGDEVSQIKWDDGETAFVTNENFKVLTRKERDNG